MLERARFIPGSGGGAVASFRGDRFSRVGRSFTWTRAIRALALLLVRHARAKAAALEGGKGSAAQTLVNLLEHPERSAAAGLFTTDDGVCHLKKIIEAANAGRAPSGGTCWRVWVRAEHLAAGEVRVLMNGRLEPPGSARLEELEADLASAWQVPEDAPLSADFGRMPMAQADFSVDLGRFPVPHGPMYGRGKAVEELNRALAESRLVQVVGSGGAGKTTLLSHWLEQARHQHPEACGGLFGWSFAEQSRASDQTMAADDCLRALLCFCGQQETELGSSAYQRGVAAARAAADKRLLVVLDGVETLQIPSGPERGAAHDPGLRGFLQTLTAQPGPMLRCVLVSRQEMPALSRGAVLRLDRLDHAEAREMLAAQGVSGPEPDMRRLVEISHGHPLTLLLMGQYLRHAHQGQARSLAEDGLMLAADAPLASHARCIMNEYEADLAATARGRLLYLLSLFDQPVTFDKLADFVFHGPRLPTFQGFFSGTTALRATVNELADGDLLTVDEQLRCHPLVMRHFSEGFRRRFEADYRQAHAWLYTQVCRDPAIPFHPETCVQYQALLTAFHHGREAGKLAECWQEIAWVRIMRDGKAYHMTGDLAEFHLCLRTWAAFWKTPWEELHPDLPTAAHPVVQGSAGFCLFMIERVEEAERVLRRAISGSLRSARPHHLLQPAAVLGLIRMQQGRYQEARRILAPIAQITRWTGPFSNSPDHVLLSPLCHLAYCHHGLGNQAVARRLFARAIRQYQGKDGWELPPLLAVTHWRYLLETDALPAFERSALHSGKADAAEAIPLLHQTGMVRHLRALHALRRAEQGGGSHHLELADTESAAACRQSAENGFRLFSCANQHLRARVLNALGRGGEDAALRESTACLAAQFGLRHLMQTAPTRQSLATPL